MDNGPTVGASNLARADSGTISPAQRRAQVEIVEAFGLAALLGVQLQDHVVLVDLGLELVDLPLAEGVVQRFIDVAGGQAEARRGAAVDA